MLGLLVETFAPSGPLVLGGDETLERRQGSQISKKGIYRDSAPSSKSFFVSSSGLRWINLMLLAPVPFAQRIWALPFLTATQNLVVWGIASSILRTFALRRIPKPLAPFP